MKIVLNNPFNAIKNEKAKKIYLIRKLIIILIIKRLKAEILKISQEFK